MNRVKEVMKAHRAYMLIWNKDMIHLGESGTAVILPALCFSISKNT
jgi:hypothetical protein